MTSVPSLSQCSQTHGRHYPTGVLELPGGPKLAKNPLFDLFALAKTSLTLNILEGKKNALTKSTVSKKAWKPDLRPLNFAYFYIKLFDGFQLRQLF